MAIDVLIKQKLFGSKTMPLEVILGEKLHYGNFISDQLNVGELGDTEFIAYNPESIGRGFSVVWNPKEKKTIALRLPQPSTTQELKDFHAAIERMVKHWDGKLIVDGNRVSLPDFLSAFDNMVDFNYKIIKQLSQQVLDREHDTLTLYSTMWPLAIGKTVPFGATDPTTGKQLKCKEWLILLGIEGEKEPLCEMEYSKFLSLIPEDKKSKYDGNHFLLSALTEEELKALSIQ